MEHAALNKNRPYRELMQTLAGYFEERNTRISLRADMGEIKIGIVWQALGKTAGVALIYTPEHEQTPEGVALLLTGLDKQDDRAALEAYGKRIEDTRMAAILLQNLRAIGDDARPLAVRFLTDNVALPKIADEIAWCVAAAFFKHKDVL